jgi:hypothetical protein
MRSLVLLLLLAACVAPATAAAATRPLDITSKLRLLDDGGGTLNQRGEFNGAPLGRGTVTLKTDVGKGSGATFTFKMVNRHGQVFGSGDVRLTFRGSTVTYRGTAKITSGNGAFARYRASRLTVSGSGPLTGETFTVRLTGSVTT